MLFIDELKKCIIETNETGVEFLQQQDLVVIDGSDVADFYYAHLKDRNNFTRWDEFPNVAPPFKEFFIDLATQPEGRQDFEKEKRINKVGVHFRVEELDSCMGELIATLDQQTLIDVTKRMSHFKWVYFMHILVNIDGIVLDNTAILLVAGDGKISVNDNINLVALTGMQVKFNPNAKLNMKAAEDLQYTMILQMMPALMTICFMHCKNVEIVERQPKNRAEKREIERAEQKGHPLTRSYTLKIEPMKQVIKAEQQPGEVGLQKAFHRCRGHFKDYSNGRGLFGKHKGIYFWTEQMKGNESVGVVNKTYKVEAPKE